MKATRNFYVREVLELGLHAIFLRRTVKGAFRLEQRQSASVAKSDNLRYLSNMLRYQ
jgi:hypothetical protein